MTSEPHRDPLFDPLHGGVAAVGAHCEVGPQSGSRCPDLIMPMPVTFGNTPPMTSALETDLGNIAEWSAAAARHHAVGAHREALMHMRNVGEVACRVIIRSAWSGPRGEQAIAGARNEDLLRVIQNKALAPAEVVSALHVLRTRGNNADHAKPVTASDSAGALFMLEALLAHLFQAFVQ